MLRECLAVAVGGALGSLARYTLMLVFSLGGATWLPVATLTANVVGCLAIGAVTQWVLQTESLGQSWWVTGVRVGLLGGLTTFSSFAMEVARLWQTDRGGLSLVLVGLHLGLGLASVVLGMWWVRH